MSDVQNYYKGERPYIAMRVHRRSDEPFTIESAEYEVRNRAHQIIEGGTAQVENDEKKVFFLLDTTQEDYRPGEIYYAYFTVGIEGLAEKRRIGRVEIRLQH